MAYTCLGKQRLCSVKQTTLFCTSSGRHVLYKVMMMDYTCCAVASKCQACSALTGYVPDDSGADWDFFILVSDFQVAVSSTGSQTEVGAADLHV